MKDTTIAFVQFQHDGQIDFTWNTGPSFALEWKEAINMSYVQAVLEDGIREPFRLEFHQETEESVIYKVSV
jgi:hypothetical protein